METLKKLTTLLTKVRDERPFTEGLFSNRTRYEVKLFFDSLFGSVRQNDLKKFKTVLKSELPALKEIQSKSLTDTIIALKGAAAKSGLDLTPEDSKKFKDMLLQVAKLS